MQIQWDESRTFTSLGASEVDVQAPLLGYRFRDRDANLLVLVQNNFTSDLAVGDVMFWDQTVDSPWAINKLGTGNTVIGRMAGVVRGTIPTTKFGFIMLEGRCSALVDGNTDIVLGDALKGVSGQFHAIKDVAAGTVPTHVLGFLIAREAFTTNSAALKTVSVHCRP